MSGVARPFCDYVFDAPANLCANSNSIIFLVRRLVCTACVGVVWCVCGCRPRFCGCMHVHIPFLLRLLCPFKLSKPEIVRIYKCSLFYPSSFSLTYQPSLPPSLPPPHTGVELQNIFRALHRLLQALRPASETLHPHRVVRHPRPPPLDGAPLLPAHGHHLDRSDDSRAILLNAR